MTNATDPSRFEGRIAVITGAAQGIGEATARLFAARGAAGLVLTDRNRDKGEAVAAAIEAAGTPTEFIAAELSDLAQVLAIVPAAERRFGRVDVLCNIAALTSRSSIRDTTPEQYERMLAVNLRAPFFLMQAAVHLMERDRIEGAIVNVASVNAHGGLDVLAPYSASKGGLVTLTRNAASAVLYSRIRINAINFGWVDTPGEHVVRIKEDHAPEDWLGAAEAREPFGRLIKPDEAARAIAFLASAESGLTTGSVLDYGQEIVGPPRPAAPGR